MHLALYNIVVATRTIWNELTRIVLWTPLFQSKFDHPATGLVLSGGLPMIMGPVSMRMGEDCQISGVSTIAGRASSNPKPEIRLGDRVVLNWQTTISVGTRVWIGNDVMMGGRNYLAGYPGHPLNADDRIAGLPDTEDQIGDIIIEDGAWLGMGVIVTSGVTIGAGTVVAAGSVVTRDLPPDVLAGGMPARVIRTLDQGSKSRQLGCAA